MEAVSSLELTHTQRICQEIRRLCQQPVNVEATGMKAVFDDQTIQDIATCLREIDYKDGSERPRTYAVLSMMNRIDLLEVFVTCGRSDASFPYADRRSLPSLISVDHELSHQFLELQAHVISPSCQIENSQDCRLWSIPSGDTYFRSIGSLGRGGEARVDKVQSLSTKQVYARRRIRHKRDPDKDIEVMNEFQRELKILKRLDHIHLIKICASYTDKEYMAILMKPVASTNLRDYLQTQTSLQGSVTDRSKFRSYYGCLANAVAYLHDCKIRHKDIKPHNILLDHGEIYLADFGSATEFDGDMSISRGTAKGKTARYQSPEVFRGTTRGRSSDVWSLGVTFLEMTTVLRGETLANMQVFLKRNGTGKDFVFENIQGAIKWTEHLRKNTDYSKADNAPMQWIKDMLSEKPGARPSAQDLFDTITHASDGAFCGRCCVSDYSTTSDTASTTSHDDNDDATVKPRSARRAQGVLDAYVVEDKTFSSRRRETREVKRDPRKSTQHPRRSPLHQRVMTKVFSNLPAMSSFLSVSWSFATASPSESVTAELEQVEQQDVQGKDVVFCEATPELIPTNEYMKEPVHVIKELAIDYDYIGYSIPGAFPDLPRYEGSRVPYDRTSISFAEHHPPPVIPAYTINHHEILTSPPETEFIEVGIKNPVPDLSAYRSDRPLSPQELESPSIASFEGCVFNPGPTGFLLKGTECPGKHSQTFRDLLFWPTQRLKRCRSDENLDMQRQAESLLADIEHCVDDSSLDTSPQRSPKISGSELDRETQTAQLRNTKQELDGIFAIRSSRSAPPQNVVFQQLEISGVRKIPGKETVEDITERFAQDTIRAHQQGEMLDPETPPKLPHTPDLPNVAPIPTARPNTNSVLSFLTSARAKPTPTNLTDTNIHSHNTQVPPVQQPRAKHQRASEYMKMVFDETASSVATSVMSTRTRQSFKIHGLMLPMQDRSCDYLGEQTKKGKADAVRMLLGAGCNPGTKRNPRRAPIFNVIRGASARHTKCLRSLLDHDVDVNVRSNVTHKTPLLEAFEQDVWSGYSTVIFLLLKAGANPNAKDPSGDVALLKLLGGGTVPLEEGRRRALALLLTPVFATNVSVTPLGTCNKPLHLAIRRKDPWAVDMLLNKSDSTRDIEAENSEGLTPLLLTASLWRPTVTADQLGILEYLLEKGANVNVKMPLTKQTPLHIAVGYGLVHVVEDLMQNGADPGLKTSEGKSAWDVARDKRRLDGCQGCADCVKVRQLLGDRPKKTNPSSPPK
ncbi:hypothetical protein BKA65DRAFT_91087 [Rhexocercosporidium sp. MPI-PUGE-AT-0058]|nr:hypothetical protein BKA65DRAFT_91087 [Rhexocercosporidium sp. MPI-PUGE-AT-0058]